jgi:hypothetical protein
MLGERRWISIKTLYLLVSLSTQSLNQFAENVSKAEALSAEVASIQKGMLDIWAFQDGADSPPVRVELAVKNAGATDSNAPIGT